MAKITISDLRHRITIQSLTLTSDGQGGSTETWADVATVYAYLRPRSAKEINFAESIRPITSHEVVIRHRNDINSSMRIFFDNRYFQIKGVRKEDEKKQFLLIDAEENVGT